MKWGISLFRLPFTAKRKRQVQQKAGREVAQDSMRKQAEEAARMLAAIVESSKDAIIGKTAAGIIVSWNAGAERLYGYSADEIVGKSITVLASPDQPGDSENILNRVLAGEAVRHYETKRMTKDGRSIDVSLSVSSIRDSAGKATIILTVARDITERKHAAQELSDSEDRFSQQKKDFSLERSVSATALSDSEQRFLQVAESTGEIIWEVDANGLYVYVSPTCRKVLGYTPEELVGKQHFYDMYVPEAREQLKDSVLGIFARRAPFRVFTSQNVKKDGSIVILESTGVPLLDSEGNLVGYRGADLDATERKRAEAELQQSKDHLEIAYKELEAFSYSVSHDLRAPLRHVQGYADMLVRATEGKLSDKALRYLNTITDASSEMGQLIDDLLAFSRMSRSEMQLGQVKMAGLVNDTRKALASSTVGRDITWKIGALPEIAGDPALIKLALANLLSNAVKYTQAG